MTEIRKNRCIRLSDAEFQQLQKNAQSQGCTMSELIRRTAIYGQKMSQVNLDMEPIRKMLYELQMQGNNLNQLAREANTFGISKSLAESIEEEVSKSKKTRKRLNQLIQDIRETRYLRVVLSSKRRSQVNAMLTIYATILMTKMPSCVTVKILLMSKIGIRKWMM